MMGGEDGGGGGGRTEEQPKVAVVCGRERKCFDQRWGGGGLMGKQAELHGNLLATHLLL